VNEVNPGSPQTDDLAETGEVGAETGALAVHAAGGSSIEVVEPAGETGDDAGMSFANGAGTTILVPSAAETVMRRTSSFVNASENVGSPCQLLDLGRVCVAVVPSLFV